MFDLLVGQSFEAMKYLKFYKTAFLHHIAVRLISLNVIANAVSLYVLVKLQQQFYSGH